MIFNENCVETMVRLDPDSVDLTVTSPPYDNLRDYHGYTFDLMAVGSNLFRITKPGGVVVWVVGDATVQGCETGTSFKQALFFKSIGFCLHDTMIYEKVAVGYPAGKKSTRYTNAFEFMFVFCKGKLRVHNLIQDKVNRWGGHTTFGNANSRQKDGSIKAEQKHSVNLLGIRTNIWRMHNGKGFGGDSFASKHPATFPEELARDHILTWSNPGDLVYDPFTGSGTTGKMALMTGRQFIGSEVSLDYCLLAEERIRNANLLMKPPHSG